MKVYVYDFDKTIYDGDSSIDFIKFLMSKKKKLFFRLPKMAFYYFKYKTKLIEKEEMKEYFFSIVKYFDNIDELVNEFWTKKENKIKQFFINKKSHKNDIIASASPEFLLKPIKEKYKILDLFATNINKKTGIIKGKNCHDVEKLRLINKQYKNYIIEEMYSDDEISDKPLLDIAKKSYIVKKNKLIDYTLYKPNIFKRFWNWGWGIYHKNEELWNYLIVGFLTTVVALAVYYFCVLTFLNPNIAIELQCANIISWILAVAFAYFTNRVFVFKSKNPNKIKEATSFVGSRVITLLLDMLTMFIIVTVLHLNDKIGKIISQVIVTIGNYIISKLFVFRK